MYGDVITEIALDIPGYVVQGDGILEFTITAFIRVTTRFISF